ncbi:CDP-glycerol glycerophosphotransferase family protein [Wohlfahrtiimonas chitiniclastica]|uniref:CDP-glycerol glycerophosphotransferase family protein n=1 Tax=Wohlfahrtiimonas chitiniclastica TaxID=400946 RepID=UPI001BD131A2|nr:CDP-glycerol glycerophosphotransferase family protein [Wohlfahrtiimonas chitiniclastica]MBS7838555.1 CDP-glycerol glycerophosphotransferase family protein [Wohlfahrtiimonas chitiniclastica]
MSIKRKYKKLLRDPKLFFSDFLLKQKIRGNKIGGRKKANTTFSVVTAVYNVEKYLDDYFESIIKQSISFKLSIKIICVDDGSTDNSANIIRKWINKYPNNIEYYYKSNGGQGSARNLGLKHVSTDWVTFIDPDDFVSKDYFHIVDMVINRYSDMTMVVCNLIPYLEDKNTISDTHPLKYRFLKKETIVSSDNLENNINLSSSASFFRADNFRQFGIDYDIRIKPSYEDAKLISDYLTYTPKGKVAFLKEAIYFYRRRSDNSSTVNNAKYNPEFYTTVLSKCVLPILNNNLSLYGYIPKHQQRLVLYILLWYFPLVVDTDEFLSKLTDKEKNEFLMLMKMSFSLIDSKNILSFNLAGNNFFYKTGIIGSFKKEQIGFQICYVEKIDLKRKEILFKYYYYYVSKKEFYINGKKVIPLFNKHITHKIIDDDFVYEERIWISFDNVNDNIAFLFNNQKAMFSYKGKELGESLTVKKLLDLSENLNIPVIDECWIFMDRLDTADDNAEHLYRYVKNNTQHTNIYFVLNKSSSDWERLHSDGFNLLDYGSTNFEVKLRESTKIISSQFADILINYFSSPLPFSPEYIFLQHGVTQNDISYWLNQYGSLSKLICSTKAEYDGFLSSDSLYHVTNKEVVLTGFPRHDNLVGNFDVSNTILVMPTWRKDLVGKILKGERGYQRENIDNFSLSEYAQKWKSMLSSSEFKDLADYYGYNIVFIPHPNMEAYIAEFQVPQYISVKKISTSDIQSIFRDVKVLITDYSSVSFDFAFMNKAVLYYQFDHETFFENHTVRKGYFNYETHGFGPVCFTQKTLLDNLDQILKHNGLIFEKYLDRVKSTFPFQDNLSSQRVYNAILSIDQDIDVNQIVINNIRMSYQKKCWSDVIVFTEQYILKSKFLDEIFSDIYKAYTYSLYQNGRLDTISAFLKAISKSNFSFLDVKKEIKLISLFVQENWDAYVHEYGNDLMNYPEDITYETLRLYLISGIWFSQSSKCGWEFLQSQQVEDTIPLIKEQISKMALEELRLTKIELLLAQIYVEMGWYNKAAKMLVMYEKHTVNDINSRKLISEIAYNNGHYKKVLDQLDKAFNNNFNLMPKKYISKYLNSLFIIKNYERFDSLYDFCKKNKIELENSYMEIFSRFFMLQKWSDAINILEKFSQELIDKNLNKIIILYFNMNRLQESYDLLCRYLNAQVLDNITLSDLRVFSDIALLLDDISLALKCYKLMLQIASDTNEANQIRLLIGNLLSITSKQLN